MSMAIFEKINYVLNGLKGARVIDMRYSFRDESSENNNAFKIIFMTDKMQYSIYIPLYFRFRTETKLLLTSVDMHIDKNNVYDESADPYNNMSDFKNSIMSIRITNTFDLLRDTTVSDSFVNRCGDLIVTFKNGIAMEVLIDRRWNGTEFYKIVHVMGKNNVSYVARFNEGVLQLIAS